MQEKLLNYCNLSVFSDPVIEFLFEKNIIKGFITQSGKKIKTSKLILTTGTFLNGLIHVGEKQIPAGRYNEKPTTGLSEQLLEYNFKAGLTTDVGDAILDNENAFNLRRYDTNDFPQ